LNTRGATTVDAEYQITSQYMELFRSVWRDRALKAEDNKQLSELRKFYAELTRFR